MGSRHFYYGYNSRSHLRHALRAFGAWEDVTYEGYGFRGTLKAKGPGAEAESLLCDWDYVYERARHSIGWKNRRHRRQWERRVILLEKRERNRRRKAARC